jgi:Domain of unknown function (DUF4386)
MSDQTREASPRPRARITGAIYLLYFLTTILGQVMVSHGLAVSGNVINIISTLFYVVVTLLFYGLFKPVSNSLSLLAALLSLTGCVVMSLGLIHITSPISPLVFFGPFCLLIGYLILKSSFLPRVLGVLMVFAGFGWLAYLIPAVPHNLNLAIMVLGFLAELSLCLWLLVMGVNVERWKRQASAAKASIQTGETPSTADRVSTSAHP